MPPKREYMHLDMLVACIDKNIIYISRKLVNITQRIYVLRKSESPLHFDITDKNNFMHIMPFIFQPKSIEILFFIDDNFAI